MPRNTAEELDPRRISRRHRPTAPIVALPAIGFLAACSVLASTPVEVHLAALRELRPVVRVSAIGVSAARQADWVIGKDLEAALEKRMSSLFRESLPELSESAEVDLLLQAQVTSREDCVAVLVSLSVCEAVALSRESPAPVSCSQTWRRERLSLESRQTWIAGVEEASSDLIEEFLAEASMAREVAGAE